MNKRFAPVLAALILAAYLPGPAGRPAQAESVPAEIYPIARFSKKLARNARGYWEAGLMMGIEMVYVPAGDSLMGSPPGETGREPDEGPVHRVSTKGIWIGKFEVTRSTWRTVMGGVALRSDEGDLPQGDVSYRDVQVFLRELGKETGLGFRLPTEAEWEKCCRGGDFSSIYGPLDEIAWHGGNSGGRAHPVGSKNPNSYGLHDMLGNVWEWCSDWYGNAYYKISPPGNPTGPDRGQRRVCRGGGYLHAVNYLRCAHRNSQDPGKGKPYLGFRLVLDEAL